MDTSRPGAPAPHPRPPTPIRTCAHCGRPIFSGMVVPVDIVDGNSGPGRTLYAHAEHATLYRPDPRPAVLLARIRALRGQR